MKLKATTTLTCLTLGLSALAPAVYAQAEAPAKEEAAEDAPSLKVGDKAPALEGLDWLKGGPVEKIDEKGKVYLIECWATWCGPCIAAIPHVNELHKKYADKGLVVIGIDVFEDGSDKAKAFVEKQGDKMAYPVAYWGGRDGAFDKTWLKAAGVDGIPHTFVVQDGKIQLMTHPMEINEELIETLLAGKFDADKYAEEQEAKQKADEELRTKLMPLMQAGEWDKVKSIADDMTDEDPRKPQILMMALTNQSDWKALTELRKAAVTGKYKQLKADQIDSSILLQMEAGDGSAEYAKAAIADYKAPEADADPLTVTQEGILHARMTFLAGKTDESRKHLNDLKAGLDKIDNEQAKAQFGKIIDAALISLGENKFPPIYNLLRE